MLNAIVVTLIAIALGATYYHYWYRYSRFDKQKQYSSQQQRRQHHQQHQQHYQQQNQHQQQHQRSHTQSRTLSTKPVPQAYPSSVIIAPILQDVQPQALAPQSTSKRYTRAYILAQREVAKARAPQDFVDIRSRVHKHGSHTYSEQSSHNSSFAAQSESDDENASLASSTHSGSSSRRVRTSSFGSNHSGNSGAAKKKPKPISKQQHHLQLLALRNECLRADGSSNDGLLYHSHSFGHATHKHLSEKDAERAEKIISDLQERVKAWGNRYVPLHASNSSGGGSSSGGTVQRAAPVVSDENAFPFKEVQDSQQLLAVLEHVLAFAKNEREFANRLHTSALVQVTHWCLQFHFLPGASFFVSEHYVRGLDLKRDLLDAFVHVKLGSIKRGNGGGAVSNSKDAFDSLQYAVQ